MQFDIYKRTYTMKNNLKYGKSLNNIRIERSLTQKKFAEICGLSRSYISEIISGKKIPDIQTLESICEKLEIPFHVFIFKTVNEGFIKDDSKKKLINEIAPLLNDVTNYLYNNGNDSGGLIAPEKTQLAVEYN